MALDDAPAKIVMTRAFYFSTIARVLVDNNLQQSGVRQSCRQSLTRLNHAIDLSLHGVGVQFTFGRELNDLKHANGIALLVSRFGYFQSRVPRVEEVVKSASLPINAGKISAFKLHLRPEDADRN
ncbi:unnamed protein product [Schistocephalus solidus]|uniref:DUF721 domain-containing protein n=1 Tax=Schistocephalus solidus TaxID=70667 RepID=A0A183S864_SCHSO|nr:unnamed protein product [Schistocephalus solidus]